MNIQEIHALLSGRFGEAIGPWMEPEAGEGSILVRPEALLEVCRFLRDDARLDFDYLRLISAVEWPECFSSVYHLVSLALNHEVILRTDLDRADPRVASVAGVWPTADWHEREAYDLMGIHYEGHPGLSRILLPDDWQGHPLRKDYQSPTEYHGISNE